MAATNRGPITTVFTPASSCLYNTLPETGLVVGPNTSNFLIGHFISYGTGCYPSTTELTSSDWDAYYYSPAICPSGWNTATSLTSVLSGPAMGPGTSEYLCCPL
jgi:hypothetical protein